MTFNPYGYTDPYEQAREARVSRPAGQVMPYVPDTTAAGPLGDLGPGISQVLQGAGYDPKPPDPWKAAIEGAAFGIGCALVWRGMKSRRARKGEYTNPVFRFFLYFWGPVILGFLGLMAALSWNWGVVPGMVLFYLGCAVGLGWSWGYLAYRVTGHGKYNSRRRGSPWRHDHQRGSRRSS